MTPYRYYYLYYHHRCCQGIQIWLKLDLHGIVSSWVCSICMNYTFLSMALLRVTFWLFIIAGTFYRCLDYFDWFKIMTQRRVPVVVSHWTMPVSHPSRILNLKRKKKKMNFSLSGFCEIHLTSQKLRKLVFSSLSISNIKLTTLQLNW